MLTVFNYNLERKTTVNTDDEQLMQVQLMSANNVSGYILVFSNLTPYQI